jgi:hypothetical protein
MASGNTIFMWFSQDNEPPTSNGATYDLRNFHPVLDFDTTTQETAVFTGLMPQHYAGGNIVVYIYYSMSTATSGTVGWDITMERIGDGIQDIDADGWATAKTVTAVTVPGTSGNVDVMTVTLTAGATDTDSVVAGEMFRLRIRRDVANDTATGDAELHCIELREA